MARFLFMQKIHINLLHTDTPLPSYQTQRSPLLPLLASCAVFFLLLGGTAAFSYQNTKDEESGLSKTWKTLVERTPLGGLAENASNELNVGEDRINVLLLGIGGENHDGAQLTDTIMIASIRPSTNQVALFSLPRDLLVNIEGYGWRKINNANAFGEMNQPGSGGELASKTIASTFDIPVHYYLRVDFKAFSDLIDILGGVTVTVDKSFTDYTYPTSDKKIQTISFEAGKQTMDGQRALMFVRSRHSGQNNEGSDFARSHRQQKVLMAVKQKMFSSALFFRPQKIADILDSLKRNVSTNLQNWQILTLGNIVRKTHQDDIISTVIDDGEGGYLVSGTGPDGAYILQPRSGSFDEIQQKIKNIFDEFPQNEDVTIGDQASVAIKNGTLLEGLATRTASLIKGYSFSIHSIANADARDYQQTIIFDLTGGKKKKQLEFLKNKLHAQSVYDPYSQELSNTEQADFLVIIGANLPPSIALPTSPAETATPPQ